MSAERSKLHVDNIVTLRDAVSRCDDRAEYRVNLTLSVANPQLLWTAAAARLLAAPDMTFEDAIDVIGPREDPSIEDCIAVLASPVALAGCEMSEFWVDREHDSRQFDPTSVSACGLDLSTARAGYQLGSGRHRGPHPAMCAMSARDD